MVCSVEHVMIYMGDAPMLGFTCQAVRGFPSFAPCLEHVCIGGGGGGCHGNTWDDVVTLDMRTRHAH